MSYDTCSLCGQIGGPFDLIDGRHVCGMCLTPTPKLMKRLVLPSIYDPMVNQFQAQRLGTFKADRVGNNDPCPCGSGKKYKKCCRLKQHDETVEMTPAMWSKLIKHKEQKDADKRSD